MEPIPVSAGVTTALALLDAGHYAEAEKCLRDTPDTAQDAVVAWGLLGRLLLQRGAWTEALTWLERAHEASPHEREVRFHLGWCLSKLDRPADAAAMLDPIQDRSDAALLLGRALLESGRAAEALEPLEACGLPAADLPTGWCHYVSGRPTQAAACWERWMRAGAADWGTKDALAMFLFLLHGGGRPSGRPERPAEPLRDMDLWFRLLVKYGLWGDIGAAVARGPSLDPALWRGLRDHWRLTLANEGRSAEADRLLGSDL